MEYPAIVIAGDNGKIELIEIAEEKGSIPVSIHNPKPDYSALTAFLSAHRVKSVTLLMRGTLTADSAAILKKVMNVYGPAPKRGRKPKQK